MTKPTPLNQYRPAPLLGFETSGILTGIRLAVGDAIFDPVAVEIAVGAAEVAVNSSALGVDVGVMVGAPIFVGVGEYARAMEVEVRKEALAVSLIWAAIVLMSRTVGVGEKIDVTVGVPGVEEILRVEAGVSVIPALVGDDIATAVVVGRLEGGLVAVFFGTRVAVLRGVAVDLTFFVLVGVFGAYSASSC